MARHLSTKGSSRESSRDDEGRVVCVTNDIPIDHSPHEGEDLMAILCKWIHGYGHLGGNQQSGGYGRFMLQEIE